MPSAGWRKQFDALVADRDALRARLEQEIGFMADSENDR
jgi:hypothetical protein